MDQAATEGTAGASGSGKTAIMSDLKKKVGEAVSVYDFDDIGVPEDVDKKWRQASTEKWLQKLLQENKDACLLGQMVLGEILACPSYRRLGKIHFCFLDVEDFERIQRIKRHHTAGADQNMLNWSSWLRMHHRDPQWMQHVLKDGCWSGLDFSAWDKLTQWDDKATIKQLDTTGFSIQQTASAVADWIRDKHTQDVVSLPNTPYYLYKNLKNSFDIIAASLSAFNEKFVPATQDSKRILIHYLIKENEMFVGGICANVYIWKILFISLLYVDEAYRNQNLASFLLQKVEAEAKEMGVKLAHLDTFDFQAKDFYLKHGYEIFGVLDDCPEGHQRYFLKKRL